MHTILLEERSVKRQGKIVGPLSNIVARLTSRSEDTFEDMVAIRANFVEEHAVSLLADGNKIGRCGWAAKTPPESFVESRLQSHLVIATGETPPGCRGIG